MRTAASTYSTTRPDACSIPSPVHNPTLCMNSPRCQAKHLLRQTGLIKPIRAVAFSPRSTLLAATGDARIIALYDVASGEQVANLAGHTAWVMALDWSDTGEYLLTGYVCPFTLSLPWGRAKFAAFADEEGGLGLLMARRRSGPLTRGCVWLRIRRRIGPCGLSSGCRRREGVSTS